MERFRIGEFSALSGVSKDTLRYYDKQKILSPSLKGENGYRYYTVYDLMRLIQIRSMRGLDLSLEECGRPQALPAMAEWLLRREGELDAQIDYLTALRQRIRMLHQETMSCLRECGKCVRRRTIPACSVYFSGGMTKEKQSLIAEWMQHMPYAHLSFRMEAPPAAGQTAELALGIGILKSYADEHGLPMDGAVTLPERDAVRCVLKLADPLHPTGEEFAPMRDYLRENGLTTVGAWSYRLRFIDLNAEDGQPAYYVGVCVEVREAEG